ncbi:MAG: hypothetical protein ACRDTP_08050 [Mycobacteriales bacterium]
MTAGSWSPQVSVDALRELRSLRRSLQRIRRRAIPLLDRIYPAYTTLLLVAYLALFLSSTGDVRIGHRKVAETAAGSAAAQSVGALLLFAVVGVVGLAASAAVDGGPIAVPVEELRVLLPTPVPRSALLRRRLARAYALWLLAAAAVAGVLMLVDVAVLSFTATGSVLPAVGVPLLVAPLVVSVGWLVERSPRGRAVGRVVGVLAVAAVAAVALAMAQAVGAHDQVAGWVRARAVAGDVGLGSVAAALQPESSYGKQAVALAVLAALVAIVSALAWWRSTHVSAERLSSRSGRSQALRTALLLGFTSSAYVTRTAAARRRRRRRWTPQVPETPVGAVLAKAALQEQGSPLVARILLAAASYGVIGAGLLSQPRVTTHLPVQVGGILAGVALAAVATRFADPLRVDAELTTPVGSLPVSYRLVAGVDLLLPAGTFAVGAVVGSVAVPALGVAPWSRLPALVVLGLLLAPAVAAMGALSATANSPSPTLSPGIQAAFRLRGLIGSVVLVSLIALFLHPIVGQHSDTRPTAYVVLVIGDVVLGFLAIRSAATALLRAR